MSQNHDSPTPAQLEGLKQAAAFAYGRTLAIYSATNSPQYLPVIERLEHDLRYFDCFNPHEKSLKPEYFSFQVQGSFHAVEELEKLGL